MIDTASVLVLFITCVLGVGLGYFYSRTEDLNAENEELRKSLMDVRHIIGQIWTIEPLGSDKEKALHKAMVIIDATHKSKS